MHFEDELAALPKYFAVDDNIALSYFWAFLSAAFPEGEDFFVRSVRHFRDEITDPVLKRQVAGFIGQEAMHGREHRALNDRLNELGYPTKAIDKGAGLGLKFATKVRPAKWNLAVTIVIEHWTAMLAEMILTNEEVRETLGHETMTNVYLWHALEESEHKAVAFDVYRAVGASETLRIVTARLMRYGITVGLPAVVALAVLTDRRTYTTRSMRKSFRAIRKSPLTSKKVWRYLKDFERRGFHPDEHDNSEFLAEWTDKLFGSAGSLNEYNMSRANGALQRT